MPVMEIYADSESFLPLNVFAYMFYPNDEGSRQAFIAHKCGEIALRIAQESNADEVSLPTGLPVLDEGRNAVDPWKHIPDTWETWLAHDFGSSAPSATYIFAQSPGGEGPDGKFYPRGSLVLVDELVTAKRDNPNAGLGWTVPVLAEEIVEMCKRWDIRPYGVADDAIFAKGGHAAGSIADEFQRCRVSFRPAKKADRITGWNIMRRLLADAGKVDKPGLYISRRCTYLWETLPTLARDQKRVEDLDSTGPDHGADAVRYGCLRRDIVRALKMKLWI